MEGGVLGPTDLTVRHDGLRVQCEPLSRTLLGMGEGTGWGQGPREGQGPNTGCTLASLEVASCSPSPDSKG